MWERGYLGAEHLAGFEEYKYNAKDTSPLSQYVMHPFWNSVVKIFPTWVAPNLLTFVGFLFTVSNFLILAFYDYWYYASSDTYPENEPIPLWIWLVCAINHFLAHTLDGIDGKQARRTQTSSPLGELFDHGLDSWTSFFIPAVLYSVFGRADYSISPVRFYFCLVNIFFTFLVSHWEKYNTGVLFLPWGYDVSQLFAFSVYILTYVFGHSLWKFTIAGGITSGALFELMMWGGSLFTSLPMSLYNMYRASRDGTGKNRTLWEANRPLVSPLVFFTLTSIWVLCSPHDILNQDPRCFTFFVGTVFSNISCYLIIAQMSNTRCPLLNWLLLPVGLTVAAAMLTTSASYELGLLYALTALTVLAHVHFGVGVVRQMCRHFHLWCFRMKPRVD